MCTGVEIAFLALAGASSGMAAYGAYQQGQNAQDMADYNADVSKVKAQDAISTGALEEERHRVKVRQIEGAQIAKMGASGAVVGEGSYGDVLDQTAVFGELDSQTIRANALKKAWGFETQAKADQLEGAIAASQGKTKAFATLLSSASDVYGKGNAANWWKAK